ncbi:MAG TPA: MBL fold metallo-hydrolase [Gemmatimonadaceae bacterium]|jgi:L-ascorbate metabolism protein UlaG (beta-lactamase superfamily)|nr:MBL fold metallo-hydrolase [Gemmatimonadaceae bacterium]
MFKLTGRRLERAQKSKQFVNGRFSNTTRRPPMMSRPSASMMADFFLGGKKRNPHGPLPVENPLETWRTPPASGLRVTWIGHSTLLFEIDGVRILTDPVFGDYASPVSFAGRKRFHPPPAKISELPPIDIVLQSHDHYDHLCKPSIRQLAKLRVPFVTSLGVGERLEQFGVDPSLITELDWWETHTIKGGISFTATPAQHFSGRGLRDRNATLWSSWVIAGPNRKIFFSADTGLTDELAEIGKRMGPFDLSLIEIGASNPAWADIHLGPVNAMRAFEMLGGGTLMPIHWGTFDLALHKWDEPVETLLGLAGKNGARVITPPFGRPIEPSSVSEVTPWWRSVR